MTGHLPEMALVINRGLFMLLKSHYSIMNSVCTGILASVSGHQGHQAVNVVSRRARQSHYWCKVRSAHVLPVLLSRGRLELEIRR